MRRADPARDPAQRGARRRRSYVFAGPCIDATRTAGWTPPPDDGRPLVYVSFGTSYTDLPDVYARIVRELGARLPARALDRQGRPGRVPEALDAARVQPQLDILAHADVFITHAGMGGTCESLWFGVPTVGVPQAVDQFANAAQLEAIGAGVQLGERSFERRGGRGAGVRAAGAGAARAACARTAARTRPPTRSSA